MNVVDIHSDSEREVWWAWIAMNLQDGGWTVSPEPNAPLRMRLFGPWGPTTPITIDSTDTLHVLAWLSVLDRIGGNVSPVASGNRALAVDLPAAGLLGRVRTHGLRATVALLAEGAPPPRSRRHTHRARRAPRHGLPRPQAPDMED